MCQCIWNVASLATVLKSWPYVGLRSGECSKLYIDNRYTNLAKSDLDKNNPANSPPISNLNSIYTILVRIFCICNTIVLQCIALPVSTRSSQPYWHSTETAELQPVSDLRCAADNKCGGNKSKLMLILLDLCVLRSIRLMWNTASSFSSFTWHFTHTALLWLKRYTTCCVRFDLESINNY